MQPHRWRWEVMAQLAHISVDQDAGMGQKVGRGYNPQGPSPRPTYTNQDPCPKGSTASPKPAGEQVSKHRSPWRAQQTQTINCHQGLLRRVSPLPSSLTPRKRQCPLKTQSLRLLPRSRGRSLARHRFISVLTSDCPVSGTVSHQ